jgi:hypothetical protein
MVECFSNQHDGDQTTARFHVCSSVGKKVIILRARAGDGLWALLYLALARHVTAANHGGVRLAGKRRKETIKGISKHYGNSGALLCKRTP